MGITIVIGFILGLLRIVGVKHIAFQAAAHFYMGGLAWAWWKDRAKWQLWTLIVLSALETICFFLVQ